MKNLCLLTVVLLLSLSSTAQLPWRDVYTHNEPAITFSIASTGNGDVFSAANGKLYRSTANGDSGTFIQVTTVPVIGIKAEVYAKGENLYLLDKGCGTCDGGVWRSKDYGATWTNPKNQFPAKDIGKLEGLYFTGDSSMAALVKTQLSSDPIPNKIYVSTDYGNTWKHSITFTDPPSMIVKFMRRNDTLFMLHTFKTYISTNDGLTWTEIINSNPPMYNLFETVSLSDGSFLLKHGNLMFRSTDAITWTSFTPTGLPAQSFHTTAMIKSPLSDTLYMNSTNLGATLTLLMSGDKGKTWTSFDAGLPPFMACVRLSLADQMHLATNGYMFISPDRVLDEDKFKNIYRTTHRVFDPAKVSVKNVHTACLDVQLYPNPTAAVLNITFALKQYAPATVTVTNLLGKTVTGTWVQQGSNSCSIDVSSLPAGLYLVNISSSQGSTVQKFVKQ